LAVFRSAFLLVVVQPQNGCVGGQPLLKFIVFGGPPLLKFLAIAYWAVNRF